MEAQSPRHATRRANLVLVLADPGIAGPAQLARLLGKPKLKGHLSNIKAGKRGMGDLLAQDIEDAAEKPRGWMDQQHPDTGEATPSELVAHDLSYPARSDDLPILPWEALMFSSKVPDIFCAVLVDDALAPEFPRGTEVVWTTRRKVGPGRPMLLRDKHGHVHARMCHQGAAPGQWLAVSSNAAFLKFESTDPGISVIAVYKGRLEPDDI